MTTISILGCGWLGLPLAEALVAKQFVVKGSTTSKNKLQILEKAGVQSFLISLSNIEIDGDIVAFLADADILIVDIPPSARETTNAQFSEKIKLLIPYIEKSKIKKVIFISSISVYADAKQLVTEETEPDPASENGRQLVIAEQLLQQSESFDTAIIRLGGLIGANRHPVKYLAGKQQIPNPDAPINLIHQQDCIGILIAVIDNSMFGKVFNAVTPYHPSRKEYYTQQAKLLDLTLPEFDTHNQSIGKIVAAEKINRLLGYKFVEARL